MNYNTQNAKIASITEKTLIVGIDVGSEVYYARAFDWRNYEYTRKPLEFSNTESGFQTFKTWMEGIAEKYGKTAIIPGMEPTEHYWFALGIFLQDNRMKPVHVNPHHVKKSKELDDNNPNKNDCKDPKTIAALVNEGRFSYFIYQLVFMRRSEAYQICGFKRRKSLRGSRTGQPDGLPSIFLNIGRHCRRRKGIHKVM